MTRLDNDTATAQEVCEECVRDWVREHVGYIRTAATEMGSSKYPFTGSSNMAEAIKEELRRRGFKVTHDITLNGKAHFVISWRHIVPDPACFIKDEPKPYTPKPVPDDYIARWD